jgi:hypothetical protein
VLSLIIGLLIFSCSEKKEKIPPIDFENKTQVLEVVQKHFSKDFTVAISGMYDKAGKQYILAGQEINNSDDWGIKFTFLEKTENGFESKYETDLLEGSFSKCTVDKIKFAAFKNELIYFNSEDYFMGTAGGEVFAYIIDFENKQVYYAHLVAESENSISLFISDNTKDKEVINFFKLSFKKDYPGLSIVKDDIILE